MTVTVNRGRSGATNHREGGPTILHIPKVIPVVAESVGFNL
jgi:hypothetical protein